MRTTAALASFVLVAAALSAAPAAAAPAVPTPGAPPPVSSAAPDPAAAEKPGTVAGTTPLPTVQVNGVVWAQVTVGNIVVATGSFSSARPAGAALGTHETPRGNILAYDLRTGVLNTAFVHTLNAQAVVLTASPDGRTVYVGGQFTQVDGQTRNRIAAFSVATGALLPYAPSANLTVGAISVTSSAVYFGGSFSTVNGVARERMAATTPAGALLPWAPKATGTVRGLVAWPSAKRVYAGGSFSTVNGQPNYGMAAVNDTTGASISVPVSQQIIATSKDSTSAGIYGLRSSGTRIYGAGYNALSSVFPQFEGTFSLNPVNGKLVWVNDCWGDSYDAAPIAGVLYVASHVHDCNGTGFFGETGTHYFGTAYTLNATTHHDVKDARGWNYSAFVTSTWTGWRPDFTHGPVTGEAVWSFTGNAKYVAAGGEFPKVNGVAQQGLVRFAVG